MIESEPTASMTQLLRLRTHHLHQQLEQSTHLPQSLKGIDELRIVLWRFFGVYKPLDQLLHVYSGSGITGLPEYIPRSDFLISDLSQLTACEQQLASIPVVKFPTTLSFFQKLGMRYVVEGSALGGQIIRRHIASSNWEPSASSSLAFFSIDEKITGFSWKTFKAAIDAIDSSPAQREDAISGAKLLYLSFISSFSGETELYHRSSTNE